MKYIISLLLLSIANTAVAESKFPAGWRTPTSQEIRNQLDWRSDDPKRYLTVEADFDGNGQVDWARLLVDEKKNALGLFAQLGPGAEVIHLDQLEKDLIQVMGISEAASGTHATACGQGYYPCETGDPEKIVLENPGINYFYEGSANSFFY